MAQRYFVPQLPPPGAAVLHGEIAHHLGRVARARVGETICLADGRGGSAIASVTATPKGAVHLQVQTVRHAAPPTPTLHVAFAPPRLQRAEWLFEHGTEVGIDVFHPLWTERSRPQGERQDRWLRVVQAAAGQCGRDWLPAVQPARELQSFLADASLPGCRLVASAAGPGLGEALAGLGSPSAVILLVGPEGGLAEAEQVAAAAAHFMPCNLGPYTLRTETAALVGAGWLRAGLVGRIAPGPA